MSQWHQIIIKGILDRDWSRWFDGMAIGYDEQEQATILSGDIADQAALLGVLNKIHALGLTLVAVRQADETTEKKILDTD